MPAEVASGGQVQLQAVAQDPDGDLVTFSWSQNPTQPVGQFSNPTSGVPRWTAPNVGQPTTFTLGIRVDDGRGGQAQGQVQVMVNPAVGPVVRQLFRFWQDPQEMAFKALVPVGWEVSGGIHRVNTDPTYQLDARKGKARFFLQNPAPVQYWAPTQYTAMMGYREGSYIPALGFQFFLLRYHPPRDYIANILLLGLRQQYPDAHIVEIADLPEVAKTYKDPSATNAEAASAVIAFTDGNTPMKAGYTVWTDYFAGPEGSAAWVARIIGVIAPEAEFQTTIRFLAWALGSLRIAPAWLQAEIQGSATRRAMVRATANKIREMEYKMFTEERNINLKIGGNWMEALGPNVHTRDKSGNPTILPNPGAGKEWGMNDRGDFNPMDRNNPPDKDFKPIQPLQ